MPDLTLLRDTLVLTDRRLPAVLRLSVLPMALASLTWWVWLESASADMIETRMGMLTLGATFVVVTCLFLSWFAVPWHRAELAYEGFGHWVPPFRATTGGYALRLFLLCVVVFFGTNVVIMLVTSALGIWLGGVARYSLGGWLYYVFSLTFQSYLLLRLAPLLTSSALGETMGPVGAWRATAPLSGQVVWLALFFAVTSALIDASYGRYGWWLSSNVSLVFGIVTAWAQLLLLTAAFTVIHLRAVTATR